MRAWVLIVLLFPGCEKQLLQPDATEPDVPMPIGDFSCTSTSWPTSAADPLRISGRLTNAADEPASGVAVEVHRAADDALLGQATTGSGPTYGGTYSIDVATGGVAPSIYRRSILAGLLDTYTYDPFPVFAAYPLVATIQSASARDAYYAMNNVTREPGKGTVLLYIHDCGAPPNISPQEGHVAGATVDPPDGATVVYVDEQGHSDPALHATSSLGQAFMMNVPVGDVDITVHAGAVTYRSWPIKVRGDVWTNAYRYP